MPPAFSSTKEAAAFALLLLFLLAAPWLAHLTFLPHREQTYSSQSIRWEKFPWVQKFITEETNDIDIAFIGSSRIGADIETPYVQQKLEEKLGRKAVVRTLWFANSGFDALYFLTKELLAHRHVKTLVFYDEFSAAYTWKVHKYAPYWFRYGDDGKVLAGLPLGIQTVYYYAAMIGMPRNFLELVSTNFPIEPDSQMTGPFWWWQAANPETTLGCLGAHLGFDPVSPNSDFQNTNFTPYVPQNEVTPAELCVFSPATAAHFVFSERTAPAGQIYFARQFGLLAKTHGCNLVALHMPLIGETTSPVIDESRDWSDLMQTDVCLMGIPGRRLFAGLAEPEIKKLFADPGHFNENGQKYFTPLITPGLLTLYESHSTSH
jgi:hypothetical protein